MEAKVNVKKENVGLSDSNAGLVVTLAVIGQLRNLERQSEDHIWRTAKAAREEIERLQGMLNKLIPVMDAAVTLVCAPAWSGVSDEDCNLESVLRRTGFVTTNEAVEKANYRAK
jgi:rRNA-processing protein FCF1